MKISFPLGLFLVFLTLKLTGYIDWSWFWVAAPLWFGVAIAVVLLGAMALFVGIVSVLER